MPFQPWVLERGAGAERKTAVAKLTGWNEEEMRKGDASKDGQV